MNFHSKLQLALETKERLHEFLYRKLVTLVPDLPPGVTIDKPTADSKPVYAFAFINGGDLIKIPVWLSEGHIEIDQVGASWSWATIKQLVQRAVWSVAKPAAITDYFAKRWNRSSVGPYNLEGHRTLRDNQYWITNDYVDIVFHVRIHDMRIQAWAADVPPEFNDSSKLHVLDQTLDHDQFLNFTHSLESPRLSPILIWRGVDTASCLSDRWDRVIYKYGDRVIWAALRTVLAGHPVSNIRMPMDPFAPQWRLYQAACQVKLPNRTGKRRVGGTMDTDYGEITVQLTNLGDKTEVIFHEYGPDVPGGTLARQFVLPNDQLEPGSVKNEIEARLGKYYGH